MEPKLIYEDEALLVLDKPPGWVVNDAQTTKNLNTIQGWIIKNLKFDISKSREYRSGIVHRLDKDTSGVLLIAKTIEAFTKLQKQFKEREVEKTYTALVHGNIEIKEGEINAPTGRLPWNRRKYGVLPGGRETITKYKAIRYFENEDKKYTLLELYPKTGRTHQIRIHLKHLGHPIVADRMYAGRKNWRHDTKWCPRIFLHATKISFDHPENGKRMKYSLDLPSDLETALSILS